MINHPFLDRKEEITSILEEKPGTLTVIVGVGGIGKTSLLKKIQDQVECCLPKSQEGESRFLIIDLDSYRKVERPAQNAHRFLRDLAEGLNLGEPIKKQLAENVPLNDAYLAEMAGKIQLLISTLSRDTFWLVVDTTERLQEQAGFWRFLEEYVVSPLLMDERCRMIFSGRVPVPWRNAEVRRSLKQTHLEPLTTETYSFELAKVILGVNQENTGADEIENAARLVVKYSCGNPKLTTELAEYARAHWDQIHQPGFEKQMCEQEVQPFIEREFLAGVKENLGSEWISILWAACVLEWFDTSILSRHVSHALPEMSGQFTGKPFFYIQGVNDLRLQYSVIWRDKHGEDHLHGVIGNIMRACLQTLDPEQYRNLNEAANKTFLEIVNQFSPEDQNAVRYQNEAQQYQTLAVKEWI